MAKFDFRLVKNFVETEEQKKVKDMSFDEILAEVNKLQEEYRKLINLPVEEYLSVETRNRLEEIRKRMIELIRMT